MRDRPPPDPTTMHAMLRERGYVACRCGEQFKRAAGPWECSSPKCNLGRGEARTARDPGKVAATVARPAPSKPAGRAAEDAMADQLALSGHNVLTWGEWLLWAMHGMACESSAVVREARWGQALVPERRFRSDFLIPSARLLVEIDGRVHHVVAKQGRVDVLRAQLAQQAGYRILRVLTEQVTNGEALALVRKALASGGA